MMRARLSSAHAIRTVAPVTRGPIADALATLGIRRLALGIHESAFPPTALDCGHGSAHAAGARFFAFAQRLGFDALQLGPDGQITDGNVSPYDGTAFARNLLRLDPSAFSVDGAVLVEPDEIEPLVRDEPARTDGAEPARARRILERVLDLAHARLLRLPAAHPAIAAFAAFRRQAADWLDDDALYEVLAERSRCDDPDRLDAAVRALFGPGAAERRRQVAQNLEAAVQRRALAQWLLDRQAAAVQRLAHAHGIALLGDLQIGWSVRDRLLRPQLFAPGWRLGAPPSRTNPEGQPWGYPLLDPDQLDDPASPARRALQLQLQWLLRARDGLRVDHPHGLVCPWIYRDGTDDPLAAVQQGTRAFESPDRSDPALQRWAIARREDLDRAQPRHADSWVAQLDDAQIARYGRLVEVVLQAADAHGCGAAGIAMEVLSTCPAPLRAVLERFGLGRFLVTQKADPGNAADPYRTDGARPQDWVMLGNHDTLPLAVVAQRWFENGSAAARADYLARRLEPDPAARAATARRFDASPAALAQAHLADLFVGPASHVSVYFTDLFGESVPFNRPGVIGPENWRLRLPADYERAYEARRAAGQALDLRAALALAVRARGADRGLVAALERPDAVD